MVPRHGRSQVVKIVHCVKKSRHTSMPSNDSQYRGARRPEDRNTWGKKNSAGMMTDSRRAWASLPKFDVILFVGNPEEEKQNFDPDTPPVRMELRVPGRRNPTVISLTLMTADELAVFKEFMDTAFERARPICELLDQRAQEAFENGVDSHTRLYRPDPKFFNRDLPSTSDNEWRKPEHDPSIQGRLEGIVEPRTTDGPSEDVPGTQDSGLPDDNEGGVEPEHDE